jgi:acetyltransferase-like isoleucine patch superfamily enzyme
MPKIFVASFNRASDGAVSKIVEKLKEEGMWSKYQDAEYVLACGDRKETFDSCLFDFRENLPIIHLWAGEVSQGTHDEVYRWAITNMSMMQLCTNGTAKARVLRFCDAISKKPNAHIVGNVMLDNMEIDESEVPDFPYNLVLYNPPTSDLAKVYDEIIEIQDNIYFEYKRYFWIAPNGDKGSEFIKQFANLRSMPRPKFLGYLKNCNQFITNSSCAEYEAQFLLKPEQIIHIGERNKDRESKHADMTIPNASDNIINILKTLDKKKWEKPECEHGKPNKYGWVVAYPNNLLLGWNTDIGYGTYIQAEADVYIDENVKVGAGCCIYSVNSIDGTRGAVDIKHNATIGANTVILPGITIGENARVPAGVVVTKDVPKNSTLLRMT